MSGSVGCGRNTWTAAFLSFLVVEMFFALEMVAREPEKKEMVAREPEKKKGDGCPEPEKKKEMVAREPENVFLGHNHIGHNYIGSQVSSKTSSARMQTTSTSRNSKRTSISNLSRC